MPEQSDEAPIDLSINRAFYAASTTFAVVTCCGPQGSRPHGAHAGVRQLGPACACHHTRHRWWGWTHPPAPQPLCSCFFQAKQIGKNNAAPPPNPTYLSLQTGVGRFIKLIKSFFFFLLDEGFPFHIRKELPQGLEGLIQVMD